MIFVIFTFLTLILALTACSSRTELPTEPSTMSTLEPTERLTDTPTPTRGEPTNTPTPLFSNVESEEPLRTFAQQKGFHIGAAVAYEPLVGEPLYAQILAREFNMLTAENVMKFENIHPAQDSYDFRAADALVEFAQENDMQIRGHTLVWHSQIPDWLTTQTWTRDELMEIMHDHITTVVSRYRGKISAWDVVNEGIDDYSSMRNTLWYKVIGPEYIDLAFQWAHEADPDALLLYNDYNAEGVGKKSNAVYELVTGLVERKVPIHGVGLQLHASISSYPLPWELELNMTRLSELGLVVHITEMDIRIKEPVTENLLSEQAKIYHDIAGVCLESDACQALVLWGFTDKHSWIPWFFKGYGSALPFDESYQPKPAYNALITALTKE